MFLSIKPPRSRSNPSLLCPRMRRTRAFNATLIMMFLAMGSLFPFRLASIEIALAYVETFPASIAWLLEGWSQVKLPASPILQTALSCTFKASIVFLECDGIRCHFSSWLPPPKDHNRSAHLHTGVEFPRRGQFHKIPKLLFDGLWRPAQSRHRFRSVGK